MRTQYGICTSVKSHLCEFSTATKAHIPFGLVFYIFFWLLPTQSTCPEHVETLGRARRLSQLLSNYRLLHRPAEPAKPRQPDIERTTGYTSCRKGSARSQKDPLASEWQVLGQLLFSAARGRCSQRSQRCQFADFIETMSTCLFCKLRPYLIVYLTPWTVQKF